MDSLLKINIVSFICAIIFIGCMKLVDMFSMQESNIIIVAAIALIIITRFIYWIVKHYLHNHQFIGWIPLLCLPYVILLVYVVSKLDPLTATSMVVKVAFFVFPLYLFGITMLVNRKQSN